MLKIHGEPPAPELSGQGPALFALGFRPFFSAAGLAALLLLGFWLLVWSGAAGVPAYYGAIGWHSHEMLFGYTVAVAAGFLLTAVRNWTGVNTPSGPPLIALTLLWLAGRLVPFAEPLLPHWSIAAVDLAFLPAVAFAIQGPLWQGKQRVNRIFVPVIGLMAIANLLVHLQALGVANLAAAGQDLMLGTILLLITLLAGRVVPFFIQSALPQAETRRDPRLEIGAQVLIVIWMTAQAFYPAPWLVGPLAIGVAVSQALRLWGWHDSRLWRIPILWVLVTGLLWIVVGFLLLGLAAAGWFPASLAKHALTVGGIGVITLGMMARVSLGHTGRTMQPPRALEIGFVLLNLAAVLRVFAPALLPGQYTLWLHLSGTLWIVCFALFSFYYIPMLLRPRVDGKPG